MGPAKISKQDQLILIIAFSALLIILLAMIWQIHSENRHLASIINGNDQTMLYGLRKVAAGIGTTNEFLASMEANINERLILIEKERGEHDERTIDISLEGQP